jgi:hypothetical protein
VKHNDSINANITAIFSVVTELIIIINGDTTALNAQAKPSTHRRAVAPRVEAEATTHIAKTQTY